MTFHSMKSWQRRTTKLFSTPSCIETIQYHYFQWSCKIVKFNSDVKEDSFWIDCPMQKKREYRARFILFSIVFHCSSAGQRESVFVRTLFAISVNVNHRYWSIDDRTKDIWPLFGKLFHSKSVFACFECFDFEIIIEASVIFSCFDDWNFSNDRLLVEGKGGEETRSKMKRPPRGATTRVLHK